MPSPRVIMDSSPSMVLGLGQKQKDASKILTSPVVNVNSKSPIKKHALGSQKGQVKIKSFFVKPMSTPNVKPKCEKSMGTSLSQDTQTKSKKPEVRDCQKDNQNNDISSKIKKGEEKDSNEKNAAQMKSVERNCNSTNEQTPDLVGSKGRRPHNLKSFDTQSSTTISLEKHFESIAKTPTTKKSKFSHDSTWMTPISTESTKGTINTLNKFKATSNSVAPTPIKSSPLAALCDQMSPQDSICKSRTPVNSVVPSNSPLPTPTQVISSTLTASSQPNPIVYTPIATITNLQSSKRQILQKQYEKRKQQLIQRAYEVCVSDDFSSLKPLPIPAVSKSVESENLEHSFPNELVEYLAVHIQGSRLSLSSLATSFHSKLKNMAPTLTLAAITSKIKLLSKRTAYLGYPQSTNNTSPFDFFEDTSASSLWFWELTSAQILLPDGYYDIVKKNRSIRKKISNHFKAVQKLLTAISDPYSSDAVISKEEEKVLKFEREEERQRLTLEAKEKKKKKKLEKDAEKMRKMKEKEKEKERKIEEKKEKREHERKLKESATRTKEEERKKKNNQIQKQKAKMMSFLQPKNSCKQSHNGIGDNECGNIEENDSIIDLSNDESSVKKNFDVDFFRKQIDSQSEKRTPCFSSLSNSAKLSRTRRTKKVPVSVLVTNPSTGFQQSYSERKIIHVPNKLKFLFFKEDLRPPYRGTWSKKSSVITGKTPFGKDDFLNYDVDSEAEWEEEAEDGEDVDGDDISDDEEVDEEGNTREYNYKDNWLMEDGEFQGDEEDDDFTKDMRKRREADKKKLKTQVSSCFISPNFGGLPPQLNNMKVDGMELNAANVVFQDLKPIFVSSEAICLDSYIKPETKSSTPPKVEVPMTSPEPKASEMSKEELKLFCRFVHKCDLKSKDKVIEELRTKHPQIGASRAQMIRKLDSVATKRKLEMGMGFAWEVKGEILEDLGLELHPLQSALSNDNDMKMFCEFVHGCEMNSREKIVDEIRNKYPQLTSSRAQAMRKLVSIANKKKSAKGFVWEVKEEILKCLNLEHLIRNEKDEITAAVPDDQKKPKKSPPPTPVKQQKLDRINSNILKRKREDEEIKASAKLFASFLKPQKESNGASPVGVSPIQQSTSFKGPSESQDLPQKMNEKACSSKVMNASAKFFASFLKKGEIVSPSKSSKERQVSVDSASTIIFDLEKEKIDVEEKKKKS